jgi:predicted acylesterase/phospholipase RssA
MKPRVCVTFPGAASHIVTEAGVDAGLRTFVEYAAVAGVSAGAGIATGAAFGIAPERVRKHIDEAVTNNRVLDEAPLELGDFGACGWHVIGEIIDDLVGKGARMGDAKIPLVICVTDLDSGRPQYISNTSHPRALVSEVVPMSMAIPVIAPQRAIPSLGTDLSPDIQLKTDGGVTDNTADHVFDARPEPRIAVVLETVNDPITRLYHWEPRKQAMALFRAMLFASSMLKSKRDDGFVLRAPAIGSGLDFALSDAQKHVRWSAGFDAALRAKAKILSMATPTKGT